MFNHAQNQPQVPDELINIAKVQINEILMNVRGVDFVMVCTIDGLELANVYKKNISNTAKLAAVSSSILAMVSAFGKEISLQGAQTITLDAENGKAVLSAVHAPNHPMIIMALGTKEMKHEMMGFALKKAGESICKADQ